MKKKELKNLAKKIAKYELIVQTSTDKKEIRRAQEEIMALSGCVESIEDMSALDELIQDILEKNLT